MSLSLSPDDDGLESVYAERTDPGAVPPPGLAPPRRATPTQATPAYALSRAAKGVSPVGSSSVVVDPSSQIPAPPAAPTSVSGPRRTAEATLVLEGRRVDELRREVIRHQKKLKRRRSYHFAYWAVAGAVAVVLGGFLASGGSLGAQLFGSEADASAEGLPEFSLDHVGEPVDELEQAEVEPRAGALEGDAVEDPQEDAGTAPASSPSGAAAAQRRAAQQADAERHPDEPKIPGDWGSGLEAVAPSGSRTKTAPPTKGQSALSLDDLEEEAPSGL